MISLGAVFAVVGLVSLSATGVAQEPENHQRPVQAIGASAPISLQSIDLFSSGVGTFTHEGIVDGDTVVRLTFTTDDVNDILKSLVVEDAGGGRLEISYPSQDPVSRILDSFSLDIGDNPSLAQLLARARGERVVVDDQNVEGVISGIESQDVIVDGQAVQRAHVTLLTQDGFRQFRLDDIRTVRFVDSSLQQELEAALDVLASNRQEDRKTVTVRFTGSGRRQVRISYVRGVPVWKSSYRLVLGESGAAQLQGWAIVENTSESDWHDVRLRLAATQPISFVMDLYSPIYRERPNVAPPESPIVTPQQFDRGVALAPAPASRGRSFAAEESEAMDDFAASSGVARLSDSAPISLPSGPAEAIAESGSIYEIVTPVSIARRGAALIPIIQESIRAEEVVIYDPATLRSLVTRGVRFSNPTDAAFPAGPVTIFADGTYVGDARVPTTAADEARLVSYAVETDTVVVVEREQSPSAVTSVTIADGVMRTQTEVRYETRYQLERVSDSESATGGEQTLIVVHPRQAGRELLAPTEGVELTDAAYRIEVPFEGAELEVPVVEQQVTGQSFSLASMSEEQLVFYASSREIDARAASTLRELADLRRAVADRQQRVSRLERDLSSVYREQERVRANLEVLSREDDLYRTYLDRLARQEEEIDGVREDLAVANDALMNAQDSLAEYINSL
ncbi:MAG: hypothetical protein ACLFP4_07200 [Spirochaetales bacterium]